MNSMKLVIPLHSLYWSIHTKDESKRRTAFAFIVGVNWLWRCGVTASFGVFHQIKFNGMTSFMELMSFFRCFSCLSSCVMWDQPTLLFRVTGERVFFTWPKQVSHKTPIDYKKEFWEQQRRRQAHQQRDSYSTVGGAGSTYTKKAYIWY